MADASSAIWAAIAAAFGGAVVGAFFGQYVFPKLLEHSRRPQLHVEKNDNAVWGKEGAILHHRFLVKNVGLASATQCQAFIQIYDVTVGDVVPGGLLRPVDFTERNPMKDPAHTCWALDNKVEITLIRKIPYAVNLFRTRFDSEELLIEVCSEKGWENPRVILKEGNYRFTVQIGAANCDPSEAVSFKLRFPPRSEALRKHAELEFV